MPLLRRNRPLRGNYPRTANEVLDPPMGFNSKAANVVSAFARNRPWTGDVISKRQILHDQLCKVYRVNPILQFGVGVGSYYDPKKNLIMLNSTSVITQFHEFAHALNGSDEEYAVRWSLNMFREHFPLSFSRLRFKGHLALKPVRKRFKK